MSVNTAVESYQLDPAVAEKLRQDVDRQCQRAAQALATADVLLVVTGAGFSADSGLAVFKDVAQVPAYRARNLNYWDISQPVWIDKEPALFYGFWGQMFNDYRSTAPHQGYDIIASWRRDILQRSPNVSQELRRRMHEKIAVRRPFDDPQVQALTPYKVEDPTAGAFYLFTSNCDGHSYDYFPANEIHDCHGNVELWQCHDRDCPSALWRAPLSHKFMVDTTTMLAPESTGMLHVTADMEPTATTAGADKDNKEKAVEEVVVARVGHTLGTGKPRANRLRHMPPSADNDGWVPTSSTDSNWPRCGHCQGLARPAIFMFGDHGWKWDKSQEIRWDTWKETLLEVANDSECDAQNNNKKKDLMNVCILEVGCGLRIPTCRNLSENLVNELLQTAARSGNGSRPTSGGGGGGVATCSGSAISANVHLVRINPDFPHVTDGSVAERNLIPIMSKGLPALQKIDVLYRTLLLEGGAEDTTANSKKIE